MRKLFPKLRAEVLHLKTRMPNRIRAVYHILKGEGDRVLGLVQQEILTWDDVLGMEDYFLYPFPRKNMPAPECLVHIHAENGTAFADQYCNRKNLGHVLLKQNNPKARAYGFVDLTVNELVQCPICRIRGDSGVLTRQKEFAEISALPEYLKQERVPFSVLSYWGDPDGNRF